MLHVREKENSDIVQAKMKLNTSVKACLKAMPSRMVLECMLLKQLHRYVFMIQVVLCTSPDNMMNIQARITLTVECIQTCHCFIFI